MLVLNEIWLGTLDSGERLLPFGLLVNYYHHATIYHHNHHHHNHYHHHLNGNFKSNPSICNFVISVVKIDMQQPVRSLDFFYLFSRFISEDWTLDDEERSSSLRIQSSFKNGLLLFYRFFEVWMKKPIALGMTGASYKRVQLDFSLIPQRNEKSDIQFL